MKQYTIKAEKPDTAHIDCYAWQEDYPTVLTAGAQVSYDQNALWVHLFAQETNLRIATKKPNEMVCEDSCLEFFFTPMPEKDSRYFNFEFNPAGNYWLSIGDGRGARECMELSDFPFNFCVKTQVDAAGWAVSFCVPYGFILQFFPDFVAAPGRVMRGNFYKCGDLTDHVHFGSWAPVGTPTPDFHQPEFFGTLIFA